MRRLTVDEYFGQHGKGFEKLITTRMELDAKELINAVNGFAEDVGIGDLVQTSGWRPRPINDKIGGSPNSAHVTAQAIDIWDFNRSIARKLASVDGKGEIVHLLNTQLARFGLFVESPQFCIDWIHFQTRPVMSGRRIFNPYSDLKKHPMTDPFLTGKIKRT